MGATVCAAVTADPELELVAAVDPAREGADILGLTIAGSADALAEAGAEVAVDFTVAEAARKNLRWCAAHGVHAVVGTTGFSPADYDDFAKHFARSSCLVAPNFAIGAVLMMRFAEMASPFFDTAEVIELHHDAKADAPSGTAMMTVQRMAAASPDWAPDPDQAGGGQGGQGRSGRRRASTCTPCGCAGLVAHQEVLLGTMGQSLTIRHDSYDRTSFMPGVLLAVKKVAERPGLTVGLDALLGL